MSVAAVAEGLHGRALLTYQAVSVDVTGRERYVLVCVPLQKARNNKVTYSQRLSQFMFDHLFILRTPFECSFIWLNVRKR